MRDLDKGDEELEKNELAEFFQPIDGSKPSTSTKVADRSKSGRDGRMSPAGP
jgi:hypothetical protein